MTKSNRQPVSVIIPTYNGLNLLKKNLPSVVDELLPQDELVIIDDAGSDSSLEWCHQYLLTRKVQYFQLVTNTTNLRFAASCNKAVKLTQHELLLLLNNDVSPHIGCIDRLVQHFSNPKVFAVGCKEIEANVGEQGGKNKLWFARGMFVHSRAEEFSSGETAWVSGGSGMFAKEKWQLLGGFDTAFYPAYWEDIDLSFRARQRNWLTLFDANAVVDHNHESTNQSVFGERRLLETSFQHGLTFVWKHATNHQKFLHLCWLPYHLIITNIRTKGVFGVAWWRWLWSKKITR